MSGICRKSPPENCGDDKTTTVGMTKKEPMNIKYKILIALLILTIVAVISQIHFDIPVETLKAKYANQHSQFMQFPNLGTEVHFRDEGDGDPLVLLHGIGSSLHTWDAWTESLSTDFRIIRMDLPAFGLTGPRNDRDYSIAAYVSFLDDFLDSLGLQQVHLAGNSLGGRIAWEYALAAPQRITSLTLIDASGFPVDKPPSLGFRLARMPVINRLLLGFTPRALLSRSVAEVYADDSKISDALVDRYFDMMLREGNRQAFVDRANQPFEPPGERLTRIRAPTLILWGKEDAWIPVTHGEKFLLQIPFSVMTIYKNTGHLPMEENPVKSSSDARDFLKSVSIIQGQGILPESAD